MKPLVSVVMSACNAENYISDAIESVLKQTYENFELIITNDGSVDKTFAIINKFSDPRIKKFDFEKNHGPSKARNYAIEIACGKYIAILDADDICFPNRLQLQVEFLEANPDIGVCGTKKRDFYDNSPFSNSYFSSDNSKLPLSHFDCLMTLAWTSCFSHSTVMIRKSIFLGNNYDENLHAAQDYKLWVDLVSRTKFTNLKQETIYYRKHQNTITLTKATEQKTNANKIRGQFFELVIGEEKAKQFRHVLSLFSDEYSHIELESISNFYNSLSDKQYSILGWTSKRMIRRNINRISYQFHTPVPLKFIFWFMRYKTKYIFTGRINTN